MKDKPDSFFSRQVIGPDTCLDHHLFGYQLEPGDVLEADDMYASTNGKWEKCPCPGLTLQEGAGAVWVRPHR